MNCYFEGKVATERSANTPPFVIQSYDGKIYVLPDGEVFGLRTSAVHGETIDVFVSKTNLISNGVKVHQK